MEYVHVNMKKYKIQDWGTDKQTISVLSFMIPIAENEINLDELSLRTCYALYTKVSQ